MNFLREIRLGGALLTLGGIVTTEDERGRKTHHYVGWVWNPWDSATGRTVAAKNQVTLKGDPGPATIEVYSSSLKERKLLNKLEPTFINPQREVRVWDYEEPLTVIIRGQGTTESWTVSHWRLFSGRIVFDLAKNKIWVEHLTQKLNLTDNQRTVDEDGMKQVIAETQLDHGMKNGKPRRQRN